MASDSCVSIIIFLCSAVNLTDKIVHTLMQQRNGKAHFNRAVLEGIAYSMKDCYELLKNLGIAPKEAALIGGGAKSVLWRQILSDMLGIVFKIVDNADSSLGSAMLAGVATRVFASHQEAAAKCIRIRDEVLPDPQGVAFYEKQFKRYKEIQAALAPIYHQL